MALLHINTDLLQLPEKRGAFKVVEEVIRKRKMLPGEEGVSMGLPRDKFISPPLQLQSHKTPLELFS